MDLFLALSLCFIANTQAPATTEIRHPDQRLNVMTTEVEALENVLRKKDSLTNFDSLPSFSNAAISFDLTPAAGRERPRRR